MERTDTRMEEGVRGMMVPVVEEPGRMNMNESCATGIMIAPYLGIWLGHQNLGMGLKAQFNSDSRRHFEYTIKEPRLTFTD